MASEVTDLQKELAKYSIVKEEDKHLLATWLTIKGRIDALKQFTNRHQRTHEAKAISVKITEEFFSIADLFSKYPLIREEFGAYQIELKNISQYTNESIKSLENCAEAYFKEYFQKKNIPIKGIEFFNKKSGVQVGRIATIKYIDKISQTEQSVSYHIKTHQHGSASGSPSIKPVDPKELFVYRVLELIGVGPEVHFIFNPLSQGGCYIATRDLGSSKPEKTQKSKDFKTYEALKGKFTREDDLDQTFVQGLSCADLLSRIFRLEDVTTNSTNFGFRISQDKMKCKIVDFRINTHDTYEYVDIFKGFLDGNGMFNYTDEFLKHVLKDRPEVERIKTADVVLKQLLVGGKKLPLMEAIKKASEEIHVYILNKQGSSSIDIPKDSEADFNKYMKSINTNFEKLSAGVFGKIKELSEVAEQPVSQFASAASLQFQYQSAQQLSTNKASTGAKDLGTKGPKF